MKILITGGSSRLAGALAAEFCEEHDVRLMDSVPVDVKGRIEFVQGSILSPDDSSQAIRGMDVLIHTGEPPPDLPAEGLEREQQMLDLATRGTHVIFSAGIAEGIQRFIYAGTLAIFSAYPDDVYISELFKPLPSSEITQMTKYLGELTAREFARNYMVTVTCLRLGELVLEEEVRGETPNLMWLELRDAAQAFRCALQKATHDFVLAHQNNSNNVWWTRRWAIYHICADIPNPKFLINQASHIGYKPTHNFQNHYQ